jgi:hypothetical protein
MFILMNIFSIKLSPPSGGSFDFVGFFTVDMSNNVTGFYDILQPTENLLITNNNLGGDNLFDVSTMLFGNGTVIDISNNIVLSNYNTDSSFNGNASNTNLILKNETGNNVYYTIDDDGNNTSNFSIINSVNISSITYSPNSVIENIPFTFVYSNQNLLPIDGHTYQLMNQSTDILSLFDASNSSVNYYFENVNLNENNNVTPLIIFDITTLNIIENQISVTVTPRDISQTMQYCRWTDIPINCWTRVPTWSPL